MYAFFSIAFILINSFVRLAYNIVKILFVLCLLWGASKSLTTTEAPLLGNVLFWTQHVEISFFAAQYAAWIAENWMSLSVLIVLFKTIHMSNALKSLKDTGRYSQLFIGSIMSYFDLQIETEQLKNIREKGFWETWKQYFPELLVLKLTGGTKDPVLGGYAVREGNRITLKDDIKDAGGDVN